MWRIFYDEIMTASTTRKSVALTAGDLDVVQRIREIGSPERDYLESTLGEMPVNLSESQAIAELVALGARSVRERALDSAYEAYAQELLAEDEEFKSAAKNRRRTRADRRENRY